MSLGPKTAAFFKMLREESNLTTPVAIDTIPIAQLRKETLDTFLKFSGFSLIENRYNDFVYLDLRLSSTKVVPLVSYTPDEYDASTDPTVIFLYGGGFVINMLPAHFPGITTFADKAHCKVIAIDYPLAPELHAIEILHITYETFYHLITHAEELDINLNNLHLVGYSSGGNLATGIVYRGIREAVHLPIRQLILLNPWLDLSFEIHNNNPFIAEQNLDELQTTEVLVYLASLYLGTGDPKYPLVSPIFIEPEILSQFPPTVMVAAEYDRLRGTVHLFSEKLREAGVLVAEKIFYSQTHNFFVARAVMGDGEDPAEYIAEILKSL